MLNGKYNFTANTPMGAQDGVLNIEEADGVVTGSTEIMGTTCEIKNGTIEGDVLKFETSVRTMFGSFKFDVTGQVNGDEISFNMVNPMLTISTVAKKEA